MKFRFLVAGLGLLLWLPVSAAFGESANDTTGATFYRDVLPILQENCQTCHREGGDNFTGMVAPMALIDYAEARPWAKSIAREVSAGRMPPWHASPAQHGVFSNERGLTESEKETLIAWASAGAPAGDAADAPEPLEWPDWDGWRIGKPDLIVNAERYFVEDDVVDQYVNLTGKITLEQLPEDRWIQAVEWRGGSSAVHHIVGSYSAKTPDGKMIREGLGSIAPGEEALEMPTGYARILRKESTIYFNMHYHKEPGPGSGHWDQSQVAFKFYPEDQEPPRFLVQNSAIGNVGFRIPKNDPNYEVTASRKFNRDTILLRLHPHMHLRGKDAEYVASYPDGTQETLLTVPKWDFNWQTDYSFVEPKILPAGTELTYTAHFDNSADNPDNPDPDREVGFGEKTTDEMMLGFMTFADAEPMADAAAVLAGTVQPPGGLSGGFGFGGGGGGGRGGGPSPQFLIQRLDGNQNGSLEIDEIPEGMRSMFESLDSNGDSVLDAKELEEIGRLANRG